MTPRSREEAKSVIKGLIEIYQALPQPELQSEANVRANFIDPLFAALGWPVNDPAYYNRETYVRGTGYADIALQLDPAADAPLIFVEAKRFGVIDPLTRVQDRRDRDVAQLRLELPGMSVDRTREEQQAINYAYQKGMRWAILTNFERLRLFNARRDTLALSFDSPQELLDRFDELWQLAFQEVKQGSLAGLRGHRERLDVDEEYLRLINVWRLRLGEDIVSHRENRILLEDRETGEIDVYKLRDVVQRILDRLVVIRYAEDRLVIKADQLRTIVEIRERTDYGVPLLDQIRHFFREFNVRHNGALFAEHLCDRLTISEDVLNAVIINLYDARFRAMSADIMGNTYEQYLGQTLVIRDQEVRAVDNLETRKAQGSYYTPEYVVDYIVEQTLGRYLYGTDNGRPQGDPIPGHSRKRLEEIDGSNGAPPLTVLDPACGSGSFLMKAYHVLAEFYASEIKRIRAERDRRFAELANEGLSPFDLQVELSDYKLRLEELQDYRNRILERHLYGVDLDPQAAELAAVNLMLRAMTRDTRLPLILNQNIKVGDALIGGVPVRGESVAQKTAPFAAQLAELRRLRLAQQGATQDKRHPIALQGEFERLAWEVNVDLNEELADYFADAAEKRPFNWITEFPEIFLDEAGRLKADGGFTIVLGNPPYLSIDDTWGNNSPKAAYLQDHFPGVWAGKSDIYYYFFRRGLDLLAPGGDLGFITARYYLEAYYARNVRGVILQEAILRQIVDFGDYTVFPGVGTKAAVTLLRREEEAARRADNVLIFDKAAHKRIDARQFLADFRETAHPFRQDALDEDSWNLYGQAAAQLIAKIDAETTPLGDLAFIGKGMETGRNGVFVVEQETLDQYQIEPKLVRKNVKNQDISRYNIAFRDLYLIYPEQVDDLDRYPHARAYLAAHRETLEARAAFKRGDCAWWRFTWPLHKERYEAEKLITPYIAPENRFCLAPPDYIGLTDTTVIFAEADSPDLRYLLALLNSRLINFRYRYIAKAKDYRYEYFENGLAKIPIRLASDPVAGELAALAGQMLDLNLLRQTLYDQFAAALQATVHTRRDFYGAYYDHSEYRGKSIRRAGRADANARGTVVDIAVREVDSQLLFSIREETAGERRLIALDVPDDDLRHFLLLGIRVYLLDNGRKQIWSRGRLLRGTLKAITVPVLDETAAATNIDQVHRFMAELRRRVEEEMQRKLQGRSQPVPDLLHLGQIERLLAQTDAQIDNTVFALYGVSSEDDLELIEQTLA